VLRRIPDRNIWIIYGAVLMLGVAYGVSIAVLALHLDALGIGKIAMGGLAAAFAVGIVVMAIPAGWLIRHFGAKPVMVAALFGYALCVGVFPFLKTGGALSVARFFDGAFSVTVWVSAETALLVRARPTDKAFVMSLYAMSLAAGYVVGPIMSAVVVPHAGTGVTFLIAGALAALAGALVALRLDGARSGEAAHDEAHTSADEGAAASPARPRASPLAVLWRVKTACAATFSYGYFQASLVLFLPLYLVGPKHVPEDKTILVTAFFAAGMLSLSIVAARLGDKLGHLAVMRVLAFVGGVMVALFVALSSFAAMCGAVFVAGATLASISPISLALQGVVTPAQDLSRANAFYNAAYACGMLLGPPVSSVLFTRWGGEAMLFHLTGLWAVFVTFTLVFAGDDPRTAARRRADAALAR
jgi:MFS family permease